MKVLLMILTAIIIVGGISGIQYNCYFIRSLYDS